MSTDSSGPGTLDAQGTAEGIFRWSGTALTPWTLDVDDDEAITLADSWHVADGLVRAIDLHRARFLDGLQELGTELDGPAFWEAAIASIPLEGEWFPRVELREENGDWMLLARIRRSPSRTRSITVMSHPGDDPRTSPHRKGASLSALLRARTEAQLEGADEVVILDDAGQVVEGSTTAIVWWRGDMLCVVDGELERVDSVTARSVLALATALGVDVLWEAATPADLDGLEVWALNALHGVRIVTEWKSGPALAEEPGRLALWRARLDALRRPLGG